MMMVMAMVMVVTVLAAPITSLPSSNAGIDI
jgi:hypothetical protein